MNFFIRSLEKSIFVYAVAAGLATASVLAPLAHAKKLSHGKELEAALERDIAREIDLTEREEELVKSIPKARERDEEIQWAASAGLGTALASAMVHTGASALSQVATTSTGRALGRAGAGLGKVGGVAGAAVAIVSAFSSIDSREARRRVPEELGEVRDELRLLRARMALSDRKAKVPAQIEAPGPTTSDSLTGSGSATGAN